MLTVSMRLAGATCVTKVFSVPSGKAMPSLAGISLSVAPVESVTVALYSSKTMPAILSAGHPDADERHKGDEGQEAV